MTERTRSSVVEPRRTGWKKLAWANRTRDRGRKGGEGCRLVFGLDPAVYQQRGKIAPQGCVSDYEDGTRKTWKGRKKKGKTRLRPWEAGQREGFDNSSSSID